MTKVFITKYALTQGILHKDCEIDGNFARWGKQLAFNGVETYREWFYTLKEARVYAEMMRTRHINYLVNRIQKLSKIKF